MIVVEGFEILFRLCSPSLLLFATSSSSRSFLAISYSLLRWKWHRLRPSQASCHCPYPFSLRHVLRAAWLARDYGCWILE